MLVLLSVLCVPVVLDWESQFCEDVWCRAPGQPSWNSPAQDQWACCWVQRSSIICQVRFAAYVTAHTVLVTETRKKSLTEVPSTSIVFFARPCINKQSYHTGTCTKHSGSCRNSFLDVSDEHCTWSCHSSCHYRPLSSFFLPGLAFNLAFLYWIFFPRCAWHLFMVFRGKQLK